MIEWRFQHLGQGSPKDSLLSAPLHPCAPSAGYSLSLGSGLVPQHPSPFAVIWLWPKWVKNSFVMGGAFASPITQLTPGLARENQPVSRERRVKELSHYLPSAPRLFLPSEALTSRLPLLSSRVRHTHTLTLTPSLILNWPHSCLHSLPSTCILSPMTITLGWGQGTQGLETPPPQPYSCLAPYSS